MEVQKIGKESWKRILEAHDLDGKDVRTYQNIPLHSCVAVAKSGIHVCGGEDKVVPYDENTELLVKTMKGAGGNIEVILKEGVDHHPHSLKDPKPIDDFILKHTVNKI